MSEQALDRRTVISELTKSAHGDLAAYLAVGRRAALEDPDFFAHLVAWNHVRGQIRDAKIALPTIALAGAGKEGIYAGGPYAENALAHLADLRPRELARVVLATTRRVPAAIKGKFDTVAVPPFLQTAGAPRRVMRRLVARYLRDMEVDRRGFEYAAVQHGKVLHEMYAHYRVPRPAWVGEILFHGERDRGKNFPEGIFAQIRRLHLMSAEEAAGVIVKYKIPFLIARGALGKKAAEPDTVLALMKAMSPAELVTNMAWLEKLGVKTNPALRATLEAALSNAATSKKVGSTLKTSRAAEALGADEPLAGKLQALQEKQLDKLGGIEGDWLVLGDKSGSMSGAIETARMVAAILARQIKGRVHLIFFDSMPRYQEVTGFTLEQIKAATAGVMANGGTAMDCGIRYALDAGLTVDGIVFVSDGANHGAAVMPTYKRYCEKMACEPTLYFYQLAGERDTFSAECAAAGVDLQTFDLRGQTIDYYSLPALASTMRVARYSLVDEILACPLRRLDEVLDKTVGMAVLPRVNAVAV